MINKLLVHGLPLPDWLVNAYKVSVDCFGPRGMLVTVRRDKTILRGGARGIVSVLAWLPGLWV